MALMKNDKFKDLIAKGVRGYVGKETGLVYDHPDKGPMAIVKRGSDGPPTKKRHHRKGWWPEDKKIEAATLHCATGSVTQVAKLTGVPLETIRTWRTEEWWAVCQARVRREQSDELDAKFTKVVDKALEKIVDRIETGDYVYDIKKGVAVPIPMSGRDLSIVAGTIFDKRQLVRGEATKIVKAVTSEQQLEQLAARFKEMVTGKTIDTADYKEELDIEDAEVIEQPNEPKAAEEESKQMGLF